MSELDAVAQMEFDLLGTDIKMLLTIGRPFWNEEYEHWTCAFEIGAPLSVARAIHGVTSMQALVLAIKIASTYLYGSDLYKDGKLGAFGKFSGDLSIPASKEFLDIAPYPL